MSSPNELNDALGIDMFSSCHSKTFCYYDTPVWKSSDRSTWDTHCRGVIFPRLGLHSYHTLNKYLHDLRGLFLTESRNSLGMKRRLVSVADYIHMGIVDLNLLHSEGSSSLPSRIALRQAVYHTAAVSSE